MVFQVLFVDGWDADLDEAISGGRTLEKVETPTEAVQALCRWQAGAPQEWGEGLVVVTDGVGHRVNPYLLEIDELLSGVALFKPTSGGTVYDN